MSNGHIHDYSVSGKIIGRISGQISVRCNPNLKKQDLCYMCIFGIFCILNQGDLTTAPYTKPSLPPLNTDRQGRDQAICEWGDNMKLQSSSTRAQLAEFFFAQFDVFQHPLEQSCRMPGMLKSGIPASLDICRQFSHIS